MKCAALLLLLLLVPALALEHEIVGDGEPAEKVPAEDPHSGNLAVSRSGQFRARGGDSLTRGVAMLLAEETKERLHLLTGDKDEWKIPVSVRFHGKKGDASPEKLQVIRLFEVDSARELFLDFHLSRGVDSGDFSRAITAALLYEKALVAALNADGGKRLHAYPWLLEGLREAVSWSLNQGDRRLYEALFNNVGLFKLEELFAVNEDAFDDMDGASRAAFRVSSGAMVMALLEQPQGKVGFRNFLNQAAAHEGETAALLRRHFPDLNLSESSLVKWWLLQLASKGGMNLMTDILTIRQTENALAETLKLHLPDEDGLIVRKDISEWAGLEKLNAAERLRAVVPARDAVARLRYRCFPSYRSLLAGYQSVLETLAANETRDVGPRLSALSAERDAITARSARARDYMDWFEISRARETSGAFDDYQKLKQRLKANHHRREDSVSTYLDRMDRLFQRDDDSK